jgi:hypothetical protein
VRPKSTTTLLFMYLAVIDSLFLVSHSVDFFVLWQNVLDGVAYIVCWAFTSLVLVLSVHTTVLITLNRWVAVWKPLHVHSVLSRRRVMVCWAVTALWCVLVVSADATMYHLYRQGAGLFSQHTYRIATYFFWSVEQILPILVLVAFSSSILWMSFKNTR